MNRGTKKYFYILLFYLIIVMFFIFQYVVESINPFVCTHIIYSFAKLENNSIGFFDKHTDDGEINDVSKGKGIHLTNIG